MCYSLKKNRINSLITNQKKKLTKQYTFLKNQNKQFFLSYLLFRTWMSLCPRRRLRSRSTSRRTSPTQTPWSPSRPSTSRPPPHSGIPEYNIKLHYVQLCTVLIKLYERGGGVYSVHCTGNPMFICRGIQIKNLKKNNVLCFSIVFVSCFLKNSLQKNL